MNLLCVQVPAFRLAVMQRDHSASLDGPAMLVDKVERGRVIELDTRAHELGVRMGQTVLQARTAVASVQVFVHERERSRAVWSEMLDALDAISPLVDDAGEGTAYLEMRGIAGAAPDWIAHAMSLLHGFGLPVRVAIGPNKFVTRARTYAPDGRIEALPIEILGIDPRVVERLHLLGLRTLGDLAKVPYGPLVRRFGKEAAQWHERARGIDTTPLHSRAHELQIDAALLGEGMAEQEEQVYFALRVLADRVCADLSRAGRVAAQARLTFECESSDVRVIDTGFAQPTGDPRSMLDVLRAKLEGTTFGSPVTGLRLQAMRLEECGTPASLFGQHEANPQALALALARLQAVTGHMPQRAHVRPAAMLEAQFAYETFGVATLEMPAAVQAPPGERSQAVPQLRLLPVRTIAVTMRGNAPVQVGARTVLHCAGPWRVDDGWFETPVVRDEYDVLLEGGTLWRIYCQGKQWYLRGAYD